MTSILVVDDLETNRRLVGTWLRHSGYEVVEAASGTEALDVLGRLRPDLVVLDVRLPDIDGKEVCRRIKSNPELCAVPVLQTSAIATLSEDRIDALDGGADAYLITPVPAGEFLAVTRSLLRLAQAEATARAAADRWDRAFEQAGIGMVIVALDTLSIERANSTFAAMAGVPRAALAGKDWRAFCPPAVMPVVEERLARLRSGKRVADMERVIVRPDGGTVWAIVNGTPVDDVDGRPRALFHLQDISALRRTQEELAEARAVADAANTAKSEFVSRMSHEFRTPLNAILGFAQLLELDELTSDQADSVAHVLKAGRHLLNLVNEVLDIARIEAGRLAVSLEPVDALEVVHEALALIQPVAARASVTLHPPAPRSGACRVTADRQRLLQVLLNMLANAVKYNRSGGWVKVAYTPGHDVARIEVSDSGIGIHPEAMSRLFQPFERLDATPSGVEGTGLGLALSRRLAVRMGGDMGADSLVGAGSRFWIDLPAAGPAEAPDMACNPEPERPEGTAGMSVLYIEDNLSNIELVERILAGRGDIRLITAIQGRLGLDLAREHVPDLVFLDLHLPDMGGAEVLQRIQAEPSLAETPVVILSAEASPNQISRLIEAGARDYVTKPIDIRRFLQVIDDVAAARTKGTPCPAGSW